MSPGKGPARVDPYVWNRRQVDAEPGAWIKGRNGRVFIPRGELRAIADLLYDLADELEESTR